MYAKVKQSVSRVQPISFPNATIQQSFIGDMFACCFGFRSPNLLDQQLEMDALTNQDLQEQHEPIASQPTRTIALMQGHGQVVNGGDRVLNVGVTTCGLVLAYGDQGVAAYHWPAMDFTASYEIAMNRLIRQVGNLNRIEIYTNPMPQESREHYENTTRQIRARWGVPTRHYIYEESQSFTALLNPEGSGIFSSFPLDPETFLDLP